MDPTKLQSLDLLVVESRCDDSNVGAILPQVADETKGCSADPVDRPQGLSSKKDALALE